MGGYVTDSRKFKFGDRVVYTGAYSEFNTLSAIGETGTVSSINGNQVNVVWDNIRRNELFGYWGVYSQNIELESKPYDPTQAGDTDDDI